MSEQRDEKQKSQSPPPPIPPPPPPPPPPATLTSTSPIQPPIPSSTPPKSRPQQFLLPPLSSAYQTTTTTTISNVKSKLPAYPLVSGSPMISQPNSHQSLSRPISPKFMPVTTYNTGSFQPLLVNNLYQTQKQLTPTQLLPPQAPYMSPLYQDPFFSSTIDVTDLPPPVQTYRLPDTPEISFQTIPIHYNPQQFSMPPIAGRIFPGPNQQQQQQPPPYQQTSNYHCQVSTSNLIPYGNHVYKVVSSNMIENDGRSRENKTNQKLNQRNLLTLGLFLLHCVCLAVFFALFKNVDTIQERIEEEFNFALFIGAAIFAITFSINLCALGYENINCFITVTALNLILTIALLILMFFHANPEIYKRLLNKIPVLVVE